MAQIRPIEIKVRPLTKEIADSASSQTQRYFRAFGDRALRQVNAKQGMAQYNARLAEEARQAILQAYDASGIGGGKPYRQNETSPKLKRYAGGAMRRALQSPGFYSTSASEIRLIDRSTLDRGAKQWYRLNFGAAPAGGRRAPAVGSMSFFGRASTARLSLEDYGPSKPFRVPQNGLGIWSNSFYGDSTSGIINVRSGGGALYIATRGMQLRSGRSDVQTVGAARQRLRGVFRPTMSQGIVGARFLDAGPRYLNQHWPKGFTDIVTDWIRDAKRVGKL